MSLAVMPSSPMDAAARSPARPCTKTPIRTASSTGSPNPAIAACCRSARRPNRQSPCRSYPTGSRKRFPSGYPTRLCAPFITTNALRSRHTARNVVTACLDPRHRATGELRHLAHVRRQSSALRWRRQSGSWCTALSRRRRSATAYRSSPPVHAPCCCVPLMQRQPRSHHNEIHLVVMSSRSA